MARLLQKNAPVYNGLPADTAGKAIYALKFYNSELIKHFEEEEKILYLATGINGPLIFLIQTILREHQELHAAFKLIPNHIDLSAHLDELGKALEIHIRKEERQLFPLIDQSCGEKLLAAIDASLSSR